MEHRLANMKKFMLDFLINKLKNYSGLNQAEKMNANQKADWVEVMEEAYRDKPWVTITRLQKIMDLGASGHYGEFPNLNKSVLVRWISQYYRDNQNEIDTEIRSRMNQQDRDVEDKIRFYLKAGKERFLSIVKEIKETEISIHSIPDDIDLGNRWYTYCMEAGLINMSEDQINSIRKGKSMTIHNQEREKRVQSGLDGSLKININQSNVEEQVKKVIFRLSLCKWMKDGIDIDGLFKESGVYDIREKYFFEPLVNKK
jgi:ribosomal protein L44E